MAGGRVLALILGVVALAGAVLLLILDVEPSLFPRASHGILAAFAVNRTGLPDLSVDARAGADGDGEGDPAGGCISVLGSKPVLAGLAAGGAIQRHCDWAFCAGRVLCDLRLVSGAESTKKDKGGARRAIRKRDVVGPIPMGCLVVECRKGRRQALRYPSEFQTIDCQERIRRAS